MGKSRRLWIHFNTPRPLPLSLPDCHNKRDFDRKSFSVRSKWDGRICWTYLSAGYKDSFIEPIASAAMQCS